MIAERISEGYYIDVHNDLERMAEHGVTVDEAMDTVRYAIGGDNIVGSNAPMAPPFHSAFSIRPNTSIRSKK